MAKLKEKRIATGVTIFRGEVVWTDQEKGLMLEEKSPCPKGASLSETFLGLILYDELSRFSIENFKMGCYRTADFLLKHFEIIKK